MPVPTSITDLSTTAASNSPAGADAVFPNLDDYLRAHAAFIAQLNAADATKVAKAGDTMTGSLTLNAAPTTDLMASTKKYVDDGLATKAGTSHTHAWSAITGRLWSEGTLSDDPNTTTYPGILTNHANAPSTGSYWHITTIFRSSSDKAQLAIENTGTTPKVYARQCNIGTWSQWIRCDLGDAAGSFGANGYAKLPGGLIVQWGKSGSIAYYATSDITFPLSFPSACLSAAANITNSTLSSTTGGSLAVTALTASYFTVRNMHDSSSSAQWIAVGY